jgi:DNA-binding NarL/FixJ family response regulator
MVSSNPGSRKMDKLRILIVEDNGLLRQILRGSLQISLPEVTLYEAADGHDALQKVDTLHPDLIFMDIRLPGESGLDLTKKIKAVFPDIMIFVLTSYDIPEYREAAFRYGADKFIVKESFDQMRLGDLLRSYYKI